LDNRQQVRNELLALFARQHRQEPVVDTPHDRFRGA
jgi:hypothetical protein